jgi:hypothetical protein
VASFNIDLASLAISRTAPEDFLLSLPDVGTADRVLNSGAPLHGPGFFLPFKRWTRIAHAKAAVLPDPVEVELRGILAHVWEMSTAQQLLGSSCRVRSMHTSVADRSDMSVFRVSTWCSRSDLLPSSMELFIPDPTSEEVELPSGKRGLLYPINVRVTSSAGVTGSRFSPTPSRSGPGRRRRRLRSPSTNQMAIEIMPSSSGPAPRAPVHSRLGPLVDFGEPRAESAASPTPSPVPQDAQGCSAMVEVDISISFAVRQTADLHCLSLEEGTTPGATVDPARAISSTSSVPQAPPSLLCLTGQLQTIGQEGTTTSCQPGAGCLRTNAKTLPMGRSRLNQTPLLDRS